MAKGDWETHSAASSTSSIGMYEDRKAGIEISKNKFYQTQPEIYVLT